MVLVSLSVRPSGTRCLEHSIFIFLAQILHDEFRMTSESDIFIELLFAEKFTLIFSL